MFTKQGLQSIKKFEESFELKILPIIVDEEFDNEPFHECIKFFRNVKHTDEILVILHIPEGGDADLCTRVCRMIYSHPSKVRIFVPESALSCGAQIALSGDELFMGKNAALSAIDDQLDGIPAKEMMTIRDLIKNNSQNNKTLISLISLSLEDYSNVIESKRMLSITQKEIKLYLKDKYTAKIINKVIKLFVNHKTYHSYPIYTEDITRCGMIVGIYIPNEYYELFDVLYEDFKKKKKLENKKD